MELALVASIYEACGYERTLEVKTKHSLSGRAIPDVSLPLSTITPPPDVPLVFVDFSSIKRKHSGARQVRLHLVVKVSGALEVSLANDFIARLYFFTCCTGQKKQTYTTHLYYCILTVCKICSAMNKNQRL